MSNFEEIKSTLKDQWLDYYDINQSWLNQLFVNNNNHSDLSRAFVILTVLTVLEPQLKEYLIPFCQLNPNPNVIIKILGINFSSDSNELKEHIKQKQAAALVLEESGLLTQEFQDEEYQIANKHLNEIREQIKREGSS